MWGAKSKNIESDAINVVIFGGGDTGFLLAEQLSEQNCNIFLIDEDQTALSRFASLDIKTIQGSGVDFNVLKQTNITDAVAFIACTGSDELNIISCFMVRRISPAKTFCFVKNKLYYDAFSSPMASELAIDELLWAEKLLAEDILRIITVPGALDAESFAGVRLLEFKVSPDSPVVAKPLKTGWLPKQVLAVAVIRENTLFIPNGETELLPEDKVIFMGTNAAMKKIHSAIVGEKALKSVVIIGGGNVGYILALELQERGIPTKLIEQSKKRCLELSANLPNVLVICGDGTEPDLFLNERIADAGVVVSVTDNDEKNLLCSLLAQQAGVTRVITRVTKHSNVELFGRVGVDIALDPRTAAVNNIVHKLTAKEVRLLATIEEGEAEVLELVVSDAFERSLIKNLEMPTGAIIASIKRNGDTIVPTGDESIRPGDNLLIFCQTGLTSQIRDIFIPTHQ
ncbi:MAG: Trk system potassium transporter TrkA [Myxococcota bacterium]